MKYAKKMKLIDIDETTPTHPSNDLHQSDANFVTPRTLSMLDGAMNDILNRCDIPDGEKWILYNQTLQKFLNYMKKARSQDKLPSTIHNTIPDQRNQSLSDQRNQSRATFDGRMSDNSLSGIFPMRDSIELIQQPAVRDFFQQFSENVAENPANNSYSAHLSPVLAPTDSPVHQSPSLMDYELQQTPHQSIRKTAAKSKQSPHRRGTKRNAQNITNITGFQPRRARRGTPAPQLEPRALYRPRQPTQSNHDFYWQSTQAK